MSPRVALNAAVEARGPSGTMTGIRQVMSVFEGWEGWDLVVDRPATIGRTRPARLARSLAWDFHTFARNAKSAGRDVLIFPTNVGRRIAGQRSILVMHDIMVLEHPDLFDPGYRLSARLTFPVATRCNDVIVCPSEWSARGIRDRFGPTWIEVIPWHAPEMSLDIKPYAERERQFLVVAPTYGHKRVPLAVEAVATLNSLIGGERMRLKIVGREGPQESLLRETIERLDPDGRFVERCHMLSPAELADAYASSYGLIIPSVDEGFGLPVLEAGSHGTPVIHARLAALQEVLPLPGTPVDHGALDLVTQMLELLEPAQWRDRQAEGHAAVRRNSRELFVERWRSLLSRVAHAY